MRARIAVLVPTCCRAEKLAPLLANITETTTTPHRVYLIVENTDEPTKQAIAKLASVDVIGDFGSYPAAINAGYLASTEPYFLCVNDDVRFVEGWDTLAFAEMVPPTQVVGINQGNGRTESFALVDRRYIAEQSGVFDQPDTVLHPYISQFCDDEFAGLAKQRGVWADATDAVIEHLHWTFGKGELDDNYRKALGSYQADRATYEARRAAWAA